MTEKKRKELAKKALLNQQVNAIKAKENSEYKSIIGKSGDIEWVRKDSNAIEYEPQNIGLSVKYVPKGTDAGRLHLINGGIFKNKEETSNTDIAPIVAQFALSNGVNLQKEPDKTTKYTPSYNIVSEKKAQQKTLNGYDLTERYTFFQKDYQNVIKQIQKYIDKGYSTDGDYYLKKINDLKYETAELKKLFESKKDDYIKPYGLSGYNNILKSLNFYSDSINEVTSAVSKNAEYNSYFQNEEEYKLYKKYGEIKAYYGTDLSFEQVQNYKNELKNNSMAAVKDPDYTSKLNWLDNYASTYGYKNEKFYKDYTDYIKKQMSDYNSEVSKNNADIARKRREGTYRGTVKTVKDYTKKGGKKTIVVHDKEYISPSDKPQWYKDYEQELVQLEAKKTVYDRETLYPRKYAKYEKEADYNEFSEKGKKISYENGNVLDFDYDKGKEYYDKEHDLPISYRGSDDDNQNGQKFETYKDKHYDLLEKNEKNTYYYILEKQGRDKAQEYLDDMKPALNLRATKNTEASLKEEFESSGALGKIVMNLQTVADKAKGYVDSGIANIIGLFDDDYADPYNNLHSASNKANYVRELTSQTILDSFDNKTVGKFVATAYQSGMSIADMGVLAGIGAATGGAGTVSGIAFGLDSANSYLKSAYDRGISKEQAYTGAVLTGIAEGFFEKYSLDKIIKMKPGSVKAFFKNTAKSTFIEGSEEFFTEIADIVIDNAVAGANSENQIEIARLMKEEKLTRDEAQRKVFVNNVTDSLWSFAGGSLAGLGFGGLHGAARLANNSKITKSESAQSYGKAALVSDNAQNIIDNAKNHGIDTKKAEFALNNFNETAEITEHSPNETNQAMYNEAFNTAAKELSTLELYIEQSGGKTKFNNKTKIDKSRTDIRVFEDFITGKRTDAKLQSDNIITEYNEQAMQMSQDNLIKGLNEATKGFGFEVVNPGHKSEQSILNKIERKTRTGNNDYNFSSLKDHTRAAVIMNDLQDVPKTIDALKQKFPGLTGEVFLTEPLNNSGYRGIHLTAGMENGLNSEIQLTTKEAWEIKKYTDAIYDKWRNVTNLTHEQRQEMLKDYSESDKLWFDYYSGFTPDVIRSASDSVIGLASKKSAPVPLNGINDVPSNSNISSDVTTNNLPSSETEYLSSILSTPSENIIPNNESKVNDSKGFPVDKSRTDIRVYEDFINGKKSDNNQQDIKSDTENQIDSDLKSMPEEIKADIDNYQEIEYNHIENNSAFANNIDSVLEKLKVSVEDFEILRLKNISDLTESEKQTLISIRESTAMPDNKTVMQKVIPISDVSKYLNGTYSKVGGFMTKYEDVSHLKTYQEFFDSIRLDYPNSSFNPKKDKSLAVIRYTTNQSNKISIPYGIDMGGTENGQFPFSGNGFTKAENGQIIPEYKADGFLSISDGAELIEIDMNGAEKLIAIYSETDKMFVPVR